jgi:hypothetical protein
MPAYYHNPKLYNLTCLPGIVDYEKFHTMNFIFACHQQGEWEIDAGEPLLQIIPIKQEEFVGRTAVANDLQVRQFGHNIISKAKYYYRKHFSIRKVFKLNHEQQK